MTGGAAGAERFASLQATRTPALSPECSKTIEDGHVGATFLYPNGTTLDDVVQASREALATGLDYSLAYSNGGFQ